MAQVSREQFDDHHLFVPFPPVALRREKDVFEEAFRHCSRFAAPWARARDIDLRIQRSLSGLDVFGDDEYLFTGGVPLNWKLFVDHLFEIGITASRSFETMPMANDLPRMASVGLASADLKEKTDGREVFAYGFGSARTLEESMSKAVGEILERHAASLYRQNDFRAMSENEVRRKKIPALDVSQLNGYLPWQTERFPRFAPEQEKPINWVRGKELLSGKNAYIPAQLTHWSYRTSKEERFLFESNTNGCAGHFTREEATLSALLEAIQRDGFLIYWLNSLSPRIIDQTSLVDREVIDLLSYIRRYGIEVYLLDTTSDIGVPSCTCVLIDRRANDPVIAIGGGTGFDLRSILVQSIGEALSVIQMFFREKSYALAEPYEPFSNYAIGRDQRILAWRGEKMLERFSFFISGQRETAEAFMGNVSFLSTPRAQLASILERFGHKGTGYEVYTYEWKDKLLSALGYHVVRAVVPALIPLYLNETNAPLAAGRLTSVPPLIGYEPAKQVNPWPHPFP